VEVPTATHRVADQHDTPASVVPIAPGGFGVRWIAQRAPDRRSASVTSSPMRLLKDPTAVHEIDDGHETAVSCTDLAPPGYRVSSIDQRLPSQRSASITSKPVTAKNPTAVHDVGAAHETPVSWTAVVVSGVGVRWSAHREPFQRSANGAASPDRSVEWPTAVHAQGDVHETPDRKLTLAPAGPVVGSSLQRRPSQRSASVVPVVPRLSPECPTAMHAVVDEHETPAR